MLLLVEDVHMEYILHLIQDEHVGKFSQRQSRVSPAEFVCAEKEWYVEHMEKLGTMGLYRTFVLNQVIK